MDQATDEGVHGIGFLSSLSGLALFFAHATQR
jgi:hypothetical protein